MAGRDVSWIDSFLDGASSAVDEIVPAPASGSNEIPLRNPPSSSGSTGFAGSDLIGIGYLTGPQPDEVLGTVSAAFGTEPVIAPLDSLTLWR